jgi:uncharacterized protein (DUF433 family)
LGGTGNLPVAAGYQPGAFASLNSQFRTLPAFPFTCGWLRKLIIYVVRWIDHITSDPQILRGKPCIKGTRIPVALILGYLAAERSHDEILREFSGLTRENISACLDYARDLAEFNAVAA